MRGKDAAGGRGLSEGLLAMPRIYLSLRRRLSIFISTSLLGVALVVVDGGGAAIAAAGPPSVINLWNVATKYGPALQSFESQAVAEVLAGHHLPPNDGAMVLGWGRDEVRAQMWVDLAVLANTPTPALSPNDAMVLEWFASLVQQRQIAAADAAIAEYQKYSGLGANTWLTGEPVPFSYSGTGFCTYHPPEPYKDSYQGRNQSICYVPPSPAELFNFLPPTPSYDEFVAYGVYDSETAALTTQQQMATAMGMAAAISVGATLVVAQITAPIAQSLSRTAVESSKIVEAIYPWIVRLGTKHFVSAAAKAAEAALLASKAALTGARLVGAITAIVGAAVDIIVTTVIYSIQIDANKSLPGKLQQLASTARTTTPNLSTMFADEHQTAGLLALFVQATSPEADPDCYDGGVVVRGPDSVPCANAPKPPAPAATDPHFEIVDQQGQVLESTPTITSLSPFGETLVTRISGHGLFVSQKVNPITGDLGAVVPSLQLPTIDAHGLSWMNELIWDPDTDTYQFGRTSFGSGASAGDCATWGCLEDTVTYTKPDGRFGFVRIMPTPPPPPKPNPQVTLGYPGTMWAGVPADFHASSDEPNGPVTYTWTYVCGNNQFCPVGPTNQQITVQGSAPRITLGTLGTHTITVTATDNAGGRTVKTFTVDTVPALDEIYFTPPNDMFDVPPPGLAATQPLAVGSFSGLGVGVTVAPQSQTVCRVDASPVGSGQIVTELSLGACTLTARRTEITLGPFFSDPSTVTHSFQVTRAHYDVEVMRDEGQYSDPIPTILNVTPAGDFVDLQGTMTGCDLNPVYVNKRGNLLARAGSYPLYGCGGLTSWIFDLAYNAFMPVRAEDATILNRTVPTTAARRVMLSARLASNNDGTPGDIKRGQLRFRLFAPGNNTSHPDYTKIIRADSAGRATTTLVGLDPGRYR